VFEHLSKEFCGTLSVFIALVAYGIYAWQTVSGQIRPHPLSWIIFAILTGTGFWIQLDERAGPGSWVMGVTAAISFLLCILSVWRGERKFPWYEWAFLIASAFVFLFYVFSKEPAAAVEVIVAMTAVLGYKLEASVGLTGAFLEVLKRDGPAISAILATLVDVVGYGPTITKAWSRPYTDSVSSFALNSLKFIPSLFAMELISVATCVYPATLVVVNAAVAFLLIWRRHQLSNATPGPG
jgi:hypothetical protein